MAADSTRPSLRDRKKAETRDRLAIAAVAQLLEAGPEASNIAAIAKTANVSPRTFHNYFANREDAYLHFCTRYILHVSDFIDQLPPHYDPLTAMEEFTLAAHGNAKDELYSLATLKYVGEYLHAHYSQIARQQGDDSDNGGNTVLSMLPDGYSIITPLVTTLEKRSNGQLSRFQILLLTGYAMTLVGSSLEANSTFKSLNVSQGKSELELIKEGFNLLRHGFSRAAGKQQGNKS